MTTLITKKSMAAYLLAFSLIGCGGGDDSSNETIPPTNQENYGGTPSDPSELSVSVRNVISSDNRNNYFYIDVNAGDTLYLFSHLDTPPDESWMSRCSASSWAGVGISISGIETSCNTSLIHKFVNAGRYRINTSYPYGETGYLFADVVSAENDQSIAGPNGVPSAPKQVQFDSENKISTNILNNYYMVSGEAGDKFIIYTYLNDSLDHTSASRCSASSYYKNYGFGVSFNDGYSYNCRKNTQFTLPSSGNHIFNLRYDANKMVDGYFLISKF